MFVWFHSSSNRSKAGIASLWQLICLSHGTLSGLCALLHLFFFLFFTYLVEKNPKQVEPCFSTCFCCMKEVCCDKTRCRIIMSFLMCGERRGLFCQGLGSYIHCADFCHLSDQQAVIMNHCPLYGPSVGRIGFVGESLLAGWH